MAGFAAAVSARDDIEFFQRDYHIAQRSVIGNGERGKHDLLMSSQGDPDMGNESTLMYQTTLTSGGQDVRVLASLVRTKNISLVPYRLPHT
jgi:hypothetical protein